MKFCFVSSMIHHIFAKIMKINLPLVYMGLQVVKMAPSDVTACRIIGYSMQFGAKINTLSLNFNPSLERAALTLAVLSKNWLYVNDLPVIPSIWNDNWNHYAIDISDNLSFINFRIPQLLSYLELTKVQSKFVFCNRLAEQLNFAQKSRFHFKIKICL